jgi:hypothetical protein
MSEGEIRGHPVYYDSETKRWRYIDENGLDNDKQERPCKHCGKNPTKEGYDACLGFLPNIAHACCGHNGKIQSPYAMFNNGTSIEFKNRKEMCEYFGLEYIS